MCQTHSFAFRQTHPCCYNSTIGVPSFKSNTASIFFPNCDPFPVAHANFTLWGSLITCLAPKIRPPTPTPLALELSYIDCHTMLQVLNTLGREYPSFQASISSPMDGCLYVLIYHPCSRKEGIPGFRSTPLKTNEQAFTLNTPSNNPTGHSDSVVQQRHQ